MKNIASRNRNHPTRTASLNVSSNACSNTSKIKSLAHRSQAKRKRRLRLENIENEFEIVRFEPEADTRENGLLEFENRDFGV